MSDRGRLALADLWGFVDGAQRGMGKVLDPFNESVAIATRVVCHYTSTEWMSRNIVKPRKPSAPLRIEFGQESSLAQAMGLVDLAEAMYNLQHIDGFDDLMARLRNGDPVEGILAELDLGRILLQNRVAFRFVPAPGHVRMHDFEILLSDGSVVYADSKCKIESAEMRDSTIRSVLDSGRQQLPPGKPGFLFVKVPQRWFFSPGFGELSERVAYEFMRGTGRVVSVKFYSQVFSIESVGGVQSHAFAEFSNPKFATNPNWNIFPALKGPSRHPPGWQHITNFPDGEPRDGGSLKTLIV